MSSALDADPEPEAEALKPVEEVGEIRAKRLAKPPTADPVCQPRSHVALLMLTFALMASQITAQNPGRGVLISPNGRTRGVAQSWLVLTKEILLSHLQSIGFSTGTGL